MPARQSRQAALAAGVGALGMVVACCIIGAYHPQQVPAPPVRAPPAALRSPLRAARTHALRPLLPPPAYTQCTPAAL